MFYLPNPIRGGIAAFRVEDNAKRPPDLWCSAGRSSSCTGPCICAKCSVMTGIRCLSRLPMYRAETAPILMSKNPRNGTTRRARNHYSSHEG